MSEKKTIYAKGLSAKDFTFSSGSKVSLSVNKAKFIQWLNEQEEQYVNIDMFKRDEPDQFGNTYNISKNTYKKAQVADSQESSLPF